MNGGRIYVSSSSFVIAECSGCVSCIDRHTLKSTKVPEDYEAFDSKVFVHIIGAYYEGDRCCIVISTGNSLCASYGSIYKVSKYEIVQVSVDPPSREFIKLLKVGLDQCDMYFSDEFDLSLSLQFRKQGREFDDFKWNYEPIRKLKSLFTEIKEWVYVIGGFVKQVDNVVLISRKSRFNPGIHYWNRGCDINGDVAVFYETEEIILNGNSKYSFVTFRGSTPAHWTQYPPVNPKNPFVFGKYEESKRRFNIHFDKMEKIYGKNIIVASLTNSYGREKVLTDIFKDLCFERGITFRHTEFSKILDKPELFHKEVLSYDNSISWLEIENDKIIREQDQFIRVNCASCMDRTNSFQYHLSELFAQRFLKDDKLIRGLMWTEQHNNLCYQYCHSKGLKNDIVLKGYQTKLGNIQDNITLLYRQINDIFYEGYLNDAYYVVNQTKQINTIPKRENLLIRFWMFIIMIISFIILILKGEKEQAKKYIHNKGKYIICHPQLTDIRDANEL